MSSRRKTFDRDRMNLASTRRVASAAFSVVDALQERFEAHEQLLGAAAAFLLVAEFCDIEPQDAFSSVSNLMNAPAAGRRPEFLAIKDYLRDNL